MIINAVAILEDNADRLVEMGGWLGEVLPQYDHVYFENAFLMIDWLEEHLPKVVLISLDHDLPTDAEYGTGRLVADYLSTQPPTCPVIVHTSNESFAPGMLGVLKDAGWPTVRVYPHSDHNWIRRGWADAIRGLKKDGWIF